MCSCVQVRRHASEQVDASDEVCAGEAWADEEVGQICADEVCVGEQVSTGMTGEEV